MVLNHDLLLSHQAASVSTHHLLMRGENRI